MVYDGIYTMYICIYIYIDIYTSAAGMFQQRVLGNDRPYAGNSCRTESLLGASSSRVSSRRKLHCSLDLKRSETSCPGEVALKCTIAGSNI